MELHILNYLPETKDRPEEWAVNFESEATGTLSAIMRVQMKGADWKLLFGAIAQMKVSHFGTLARYAEENERVLVHRLLEYKRQQG